MYFLTEGTCAFCRFCPRAKNSTFIAKVNWIFTREDVKLFSTFVVKIAEEYGQKTAAGFAPTAVFSFFRFYIETARFAVLHEALG